MEKTQLIEDVQRLKDNLGELPEPVVKPSFIMVSGLPGTGKSYFCRRLVDRVPLATLESDSLRKSLFPSPSYSARESFRLFQACSRLTEELLRRGISLALDATNLEEHHRERFYHIAEQVGANLIIVRIDAPPDVVHQRLEQRCKGMNPEDNSEADWRVYRRMKSTAQRIRRNHFAVDTSKDITPVIDKIVRQTNR
jgi:predicted kinase